MNTRLLSRIFLAALLATAINLGTPHAFAGEKEDTDSSEAADKADKAAEAADSAWDEYEKQKADAKDDGKTDKEAEEAAADAKKAAGQAEADANKAAGASKAADKAAKEADDKEIENRADKKDKEDMRKNRHKKRAERRQARKHLRELKAELRKRKRIGGEKDSSKTKKLEKEIEDLEKSLGVQPPPKQPAPLPGSEGSSLGQIISSGKASADISGTGETIGHVADLKIQNLTDQPLTCVIPPMILESASEKNQHYACPHGQSVTLDPQQTKTVPMNGVCLNRNKPPVGKGVSGDLVVNEANPTVPQNPNSHLPATEASKLLQICASKYDAAEKLQKEGALKDLPYHDPQKQKDIVVQWSTWTDPVICQITGSPPATKEDLRKVVYKQVKEPMTPATKKKIDKGIDTIFEKVELTTAKAKDLEKPGPFFEGPVLAEKPGPMFKPATGEQPATVAQPGDVVHVEEAPVGAKGHWMVKVKLGKKIVEVWFETDDKPALQFCDWIKINKTGTSASGKVTVIEDYEKTQPPKEPPRQPPTEPVPPTVSEPTPTPTPSPPPPTETPTATQSPQSPGSKTEPEKPKDEVVKPPEPWAPPDLPDELKPYWEALKYAVDGSEFAGAVPPGKDALGAAIARANVKIRAAMIKGDEKEQEFYEKLKKKLTDIYNSMRDEE